MSYELRGKTCGYDNIAAGAATGVERTINGAAPPAEMYPSGLGDTDGAQHVTNIAAGETDSSADHEHITNGGGNTPTVEALATSDFPGFTS